MKNILNKIIDEGKILGVLLTPFGIFTKKGISVLKDNGFPQTFPQTAADCKIRHSAYLLLSGLLLSTEFTTTMIYGIMAFNNGSINYKHWSKIREERMIQHKLNYQNELRQEFQLLDLNNDAIIDSTEFIYRK